MKEITLKIPDNQLSFFMELFARLGIEVAEEVDIPEKHKEIVRERLRTTNPEEMIPWSEARKQLNFNSMP